MSIQRAAMLLWVALVLLASLGHAMPPRKKKRTACSTTQRTPPRPTPNPTTRKTPEGKASYCTTAGNRYFCEPTPEEGRDSAGKAKKRKTGQNADNYAKRRLRQQKLDFG